MIGRQFILLIFISCLQAEILEIEAAVSSTTTTINFPDIPLEDLQGNDMVLAQAIHLALGNTDSIITTLLSDDGAGGSTVTFTIDGNEPKVKDDDFESTFLEALNDVDPDLAAKLSAAMGMTTLPADATTAADDATTAAADTTVDPAATTAPEDATTVDPAATTVDPAATTSDQTTVAATTEVTTMAATTAPVTTAAAATTAGADTTQPDDSATTAFEQSTAANGIESSIIFFTNPPDVPTTTPASEETTDPNAVQSSVIYIYPETTPGATTAAATTADPAATTVAAVQSSVIFIYPDGPTTQGAETTAAVTTVPVTTVPATTVPPAGETTAALIVPTTAAADGGTTGETTLAVTTFNPFLNSPSRAIMAALDDMMTNFNNGDYFGASDNFAEDPLYISDGPVAGGSLPNSAPTQDLAAFRLTYDETIVEKRGQDEISDLMEYMNTNMNVHTMGYVLRAHATPAGGFGDWRNFEARGDLVFNNHIKAGTFRLSYAYNPYQEKAVITRMVYNLLEREEEGEEREVEMEEVEAAEVAEVEPAEVEPAEVEPAAAAEVEPMEVEAAAGAEVERRTAGAEVEPGAEIEALDPNTPLQWFPEVYPKYPQRRPPGAIRLSQPRAKLQSVMSSKARDFQELYPGHESEPAALLRSTHKQHLLTKTRQETSECLNGRPVCGETCCGERSMCSDRTGFAKCEIVCAFNQKICIGENDSWSCCNSKDQYCESIDDTHSVCKDHTTPSDIVFVFHGESDDCKNIKFEATDVAGMLGASVYEGKNYKATVDMMLNKGIKDLETTDSLDEALSSYNVLLTDPYMQEGFFLESIEGTASLESYENNVLKGTISAAHRDAGVSATIKFSIDLSGCIDKLDNMIHIAYDFFNTYAHDVAPHAHLWRDVMSGILGISPEDLDLNFQNLRKGVELNFFTDNIPENIDVNGEFRDQVQQSPILKRFNPVPKLKTIHNSRIDNDLDEDQKWENESPIFLSAKHKHHHKDNVCNKDQRQCNNNLGNVNCCENNEICDTNTATCSLYNSPRSVTFSYYGPLEDESVSIETTSLIDVTGGSQNVDYKALAYIKFPSELFNSDITLDAIQKSSVTTSLYVFDSFLNQPLLKTIPGDIRFQHLSESQLTGVLKHSSTDFKCKIIFTLQLSDALSKKVVSVTQKYKGDINAFGRNPDAFRESAASALGMSTSNVAVTFESSGKGSDDTVSVTFVFTDSPIPDEVFGSMPQQVMEKINKSLFSHPLLQHILMPDSGNKPQSKLLSRAHTTGTLTATQKTQGPSLFGQIEPKYTLLFIFTVLFTVTCVGICYFCVKQHQGERKAYNIMLDDNMNLHPQTKASLSPYRTQEDVKEYFA